MGQIISPPVPEATDEDYEIIQGGKPTVTEENGMFTIKHNYPGGEDMIVKSRMEPEKVTLEVKGKGFREFDATLLRQFHGDPCEGRSLSMGGEGYDRG